MGGDGYENPRLDDKKLYNDYIHDDLYERRHAVGDVVAVELDYLNSELDGSMRARGGGGWPPISCTVVGACGRLHVPLPRLLVDRPIGG